MLLDLSQGRQLLGIDCALARSRPGPIYGLRRLRCLDSYRKYHQRQKHQTREQRKPPVCCDSHVVTPGRTSSRHGQTRRPHQPTGKPADASIMVVYGPEVAWITLW